MKMEIPSTLIGNNLCTPSSLSSSCRNRSMLVEMATNGASFSKPQRIQGFTAVVTSAAWEWFLIFLSLIDNVLSYLLTKFASYCKLQTPCVLCSRIEYVLGGRSPIFYQSLLCSGHRSEISSLISCYIHIKVADGNGMCDHCLLSFIAKTKPNRKGHRWLAGKLGLILGGCGFQSSLLRRDLITNSMGSRSCTCCGEVGKSGQNFQRSLQINSQGRVVLKPNIPIAHVPRKRHSGHQNNSRKVRDKYSGSATYQCLRRSVDPLPHVGNTELKLTSDSESEFPFSDDDDVGSLIPEKIELLGGHVARRTPLISSKAPLYGSNPEKPNSSSHNSMLSLLGAVNDCGLGQSNWQQANQKIPNSEFPELISIDQVSRSPDSVKFCSAESEESKINSCLSENSLPVALCELITSDGTHPFAGASPEKYVSPARDIGLVSTNQREGGFKKSSTRAEASISYSTVHDSTLVNIRRDDLNNMSKLPATSKERRVPSKAREQLTTEEVDRVEEHLKLSPSHYSSTKRSNMSPAIPTNHVHHHHSEIQADTSDSNATQVLHKSTSVASGIESWDGSNVSEIEGECIVDRLKRQIEYDKKCMSSLHKELKEERNAATIAANEAMAMITRLQEEKASLHMEALQYLRMMEEQAEYDVDELEKSNDLLAEKEKEVQDLEAELELYRLNFTNEPTFENMPGESDDFKGENITVQNGSVPHITNDMDFSSNSKITGVFKGHDEAVIPNTTREFKEEKLYVLGCLNSLEKKLHQNSSDGISSDKPNGKPEGSKSDQQGSSTQKILNRSNGNLTDQKA